MRMRLLGGLEVEGVDNRQLGSRKARTLLKLLALARSTPVSADRIADVLWGDDQPAKPTDQIGVLVSRLRTTLGGPDAITRTDAGWTLHVDWLDVVELDARVDEAANASTASASLAAARAALALVRGELLADEPDAPWADTDCANVGRTIARARLLAADAALAAGMPSDAAAEAERALDHDPYDEAALRVLMRAHVAAGRPASALAAYARTRERLIDDLGVDPTKDTEDLHTAILLAPDAPPPVAPTTNLVGRDRELAFLDTVLEAGAVVVEGEAGIGKTALVTTWARDRAVLVGRCDELGRDLPLQPILDALAPHLDDTHLDAGAAVDAADARAQLFEHLRDVVRGTGAVLVIEDIHLAGASTLEWLAFAARRTTPLVVTTRPGTALPATRTLHLGPLDVDAARALVGDDRADDLHARSGGNPLFLVELATTDGELPASVRDAVAARIDDLGDAATTLRTAAILGRVDVDLLAGILELPVGTLLDHIDAGVAARIIEPSLAFRHDVVREALVEGTNAARRAFVHREAARVLSARPHPDPLAVAHHAQHGGDVDTAANALLDAERIASARFDTAEAERLLDLAIVLRDDPVLRAERARIRIARWDLDGARDDARAAGNAAIDVAAWVEYYARDYDLALRFGDEAIARATDDASRATCLAMTGRVLHARGDIAAALERLERAVDAAPPETLGFARAWLANLRNHQGSPADAAELVERALVDGRWLGHPFALHQAHFVRVMTLGHRGRIADALAASDVGTRVTVEAGESGVRYVFGQHNVRSWLLRAVGRLDEADELSEHVHASTTAPAMREMHIASLLDLIDTPLFRRDADAAAGAVERARAIGEFTGTMAWHHRQRFLVQQARLAKLVGDDPVPLATAAIDDAVERGTARYEVLARAVLGELDPRLDAVAGLEAWWVSAELGRWDDADRRAEALMRGAGSHAETMRAWMTSRFSALGR